MESLKKLVNDFRIISKRIEIEYAVISDKSARIDTHNKLKDSGVETNLSEYGVIQRDICRRINHFFYNICNYFTNYLFFI